MDSWKKIGRKAPSDLNSRLAALGIDSNLVDKISKEQSSLALTGLSTSDDCFDMTLLLPIIAQALESSDYTILHSLNELQVDGFKVTGSALAKILEESARDTEFENEFVEKAMAEV